MKTKTDEQRALSAKTPEEAESLEANALKGGNKTLAQLARRRGIELRARINGQGAITDIEHECVESVYALEKCSGKRANYTWRMLKARGILPAVEQLVTKKQESPGYTKLAELGLQRYAFEAVVLRHKDAFTPEAVAASLKRLGPDWHE